MRWTASSRKRPTTRVTSAGFVGWQPGELAAELGAGYWYTAEPDAALFFRKETEGLWEELLRRLQPGSGEPSSAAVP